MAADPVRVLARAEQHVVEVGDDLSCGIFLSDVAGREYEYHYSHEYRFDRKRSRFHHYPHPHASATC
jgi:hypothetical protein